MWLQCPSNYDYATSTMRISQSDRAVHHRKSRWKLKQSNFNFTKIGRQYRNNSLTTRHMHKRCTGTYHACFSSQQSYSVHIKATAAMCKCPTTEGNAQNNETWLKLRFCFRLVQQNKHCYSRTQCEAGWIKCCNKTVFNGQSLFQRTSQRTKIKSEDFIFYVYSNKKKHIYQQVTLYTGAT